MLHEIIMCLLGNVGGLFQSKTEHSIKKFKLVENLEFIHPAEIEICNKLAELGYSYKRIDTFVQKYSFGKTINEKNSERNESPLKYGLYLASLCDALKLAVLTPYRQVISSLEKSLLKEHYLNVTYLQTHLETHFILFQTICNLLTELERKQLHGCQIIDLIYRYSISGNLTIKATFNELLQITQEVMYKQLRDWMVCGQLNDKYEEFFICIDDKRQQEVAVHVGGQCVQQSMIDSIMGEDVTSGSATSVNEVEELFFGQNRFTSTYSQYTLSSAKLPAYINLKVANKILFTGELLQLFQSQQPEINEAFELNTTATKQISTKSNPVSSQRQANNEFSCMNEKLDEFSKEIYEISKQEFSIINFEELINTIRNHVSESVWSLIVNKYNLIGEFQKLKDMFLISRGELFSTFLESASTLLCKVVDQNFEYSINYYFQKSISRMLLDEEAWISKFRVIVHEAKSTGQDGWSRIGLTYKVEWPFHSLITPKVLKKYNEIFSFLLLIRRVHMQLSKCFSLQIRLKKMRLSPVSLKVASARLHMSFLIDNLQFYLQADVLETQFMELENKIKQSKDFEQIRFAHDTFLTKIQTQTFLLNKTVYNLLNEIMQSCLSFSNLLITSVESSKEIPHDQMQSIIKDFQNHTHVLYKSFKSLERRQLGSHLEQLLTRINYNNYLADNDGFLMK